MQHHLHVSHQMITLLSEFWTEYKTFKQTFVGRTNEWRADQQICTTGDKNSFRIFQTCLNEVNKYVNNTYLEESYRSEITNALWDLWIEYTIVVFKYSYNNKQFQPRDVSVMVDHRTYGLVPMTTFARKANRIIEYMGFIYIDKTCKASLELPFIPFTDATVYRKPHPIMKWALACLRHRFGNDPTSVLQTFIRTL